MSSIRTIRFLDRRDYRLLLRDSPVESKSIGLFQTLLTSDLDQRKRKIPGCVQVSVKCETTPGAPESLTKSITLRGPSTFRTSLTCVGGRYFANEDTSFCAVSVQLVEDFGVSPMGEHSGTTPALTQVFDALPVHLAHTIETNLID